MSLWTFFKLFAGLTVLAVMAFTSMLAYHITVKPLGGIFEKLVPNPAEIAGKQADAEFVKMLDTASLPEIDPGEKAFQKAHELLALGKINEAREKLTAIVNVFPSSPAAPVARRIVGEMGLDEILSASHEEGKKCHVVKRGDSYLGIAAQYHTTLDLMMHLNGMMELKNIIPGQELIVLPLDFLLLIEPKRKALSVWNGPRFIREYPIIHLNVSGSLAVGKTKIKSKFAESEGRQVPPQSKDYRGAQKVIQLEKPSLQIRGAEETDEHTRGGVVLLPQDMEEVSLLTRVGNEVEIR